MTHKHRPAQRRTVPFVGPLQSRHPNPRAHGNVTEIATCNCGATRRTNRNFGYEEHGAWSDCFFAPPAQQSRRADT